MSILKSIESKLINLPPLWKVLGGFVVAFVLMWVLNAIWGVTITMGGRAIGIPEGIRRTISRLGGLVIQVAVFYAAGRVILQRRLLAECFPQHNWLNLLIGIGLGTLAMSILFVIFFNFGWLTVEGWLWHTMPFAAWLEALWLVLLLNAVVAIGEEFVFRGFLLTGLAETLPTPAALLAMAAPFAALHWLVADAAGSLVMVFVGVLLAGIMLGWAYLRSGSLWLPVGIHFAWNLFQDDIFNLNADAVAPVGAITHFDGPAWLVGTAYGVETGLLVLVPLAIVCAGIWLLPRKDADQTASKTG